MNLLKVQPSRGLVTHNVFSRCWKILNIRLANTKVFQDHQHFEPQLLEKLAENQPLFMTEKDAVKCQAFAKENWWYVPVDAEIVEAENQGQKLPQLWEKIRHLV